jgi:membrane protein implicated in regulation of membrane protease activity
MAFLVSVIVGLVFLEGAARWLVIAAGVVVEVGEAALMMRWSRRARPAVGVEAFVGRRAVTATRCEPGGQVRIDGEIWAARCAEGCEAGETVTVTGVEGLTLVVARMAPSTGPVP